MMAKNSRVQLAALLRTAAIPESCRKVLLPALVEPAHHQICKYYQSTSKAPANVLQNLIVRQGPRGYYDGFLSNS